MHDRAPVSCAAALLVGAHVALATVACGASAGDEGERSVPAPQRVQPDGSIKLSESDRTALSLAVAPATEDSLPDAVLRFGVIVVRPADDAPVIAPVTGRIARAPLVRLGESVRAGAPVVEIMPVLDAPDRISVGTQSAEREGLIEAARRELARIEAERDRARTLAPQVVSVAKLQETEAAAAEARARLQGLERARSVSSGVQTKAVSVGAPIAGTIAALNANVGASVRTGDVLGRVLRRGPIWVDVAVPPDEPPGDRYEVMSAGARLDHRGRWHTTRPHRDRNSGSRNRWFRPGCGA